MAQKDQATGKVRGRGRRKKEGAGSDEDVNMNEDMLRESIS